MYKFLFILIALYTHSFSLYALEINPIIISADKIKAQLNKVSSNVTVITEDKISEYTQLDELLSNESDISISRGGPKGAVTSLFLRGTESNHTLVIIDGIVMNDPSNVKRAFDIGRLSLNNIEQIEIIKGSQGLLYGPNAIGGVILITSKGSTKKTQTTGSLEYGSFNTANAGLSFNKNFDDSFLSLSLDALSSDGHSTISDPKRHNEKDGDKRLNFSGQYKKDLPENAQVQLIYRRTHDKYDIDGADFDPLAGTLINRDDPNDHVKSKEEYYKVSLTQNFSHSESQFNYTSMLNENRTYVVPDEFSSEENFYHSHGESKTMNFNHTRYWSDLFTQMFQVEYQSESIINAKNKIDKNENLSYLIYNRLDWDHHVLNFGLRLDDNKIFNNSLNYKLSYLASFNKFLFRTNTSSGLITPSLYQLLDSVSGNKDLKPEKSISYDLGVEYNPSTGQKIITSFFETYIRDRHAPSATSWAMINEGKSKITGVEASHQIFLTQDLQWRNSYTWIEAYSKATSTRLLRRPSHSWASLMNYQLDLHRFSLEGRYIGTKYDFGGEKISSYIYFNLFYHYHVNEKLTAHFKLNNILNKKYVEVAGYNTGLRSATLGLKYNF